MPSEVAGYIIKAIAAEGIKALIVKAVVYVAFSFAMAAASKALMGRPKLGSGGSRELIVRSSIASRGIIYGECTVGGVVAYMGTCGPQNEYLDYVVAIAGHQVEAISDVWFDDTLVPNSEIGSGVTAGGAVGGTGEFKPRSGVVVAYVFKYYGTSSQAASDILTTPIIGYTEWTSAHRLRGIAYVHIRLRRNSKTYESGPPQSFRFRVKGAKVYDPRKDSTNGGSGSHRLEDATTWEYSNNPALCVADYIVGGTIANDTATPIRRRGFGAATSDVDWPSVIAAANICDESVTVPSGTQKRFECDGVLYPSDDSPDADCLEQLLTSMMGQVTFSGGKYYIHAGAYETPAYTLTEADLAGTLTVDTAVGRADRYNTVRGTRYDLVEGNATEFYPQADASYIATDGQALYHDIELPCTANEYRAQRIAKVILRRSREMQTIVWPGQLSAAKVGICDTVYVTLPELGYYGKVFRCINRKRRVASDGSDALVELTLREENSATYLDPDVSAYTIPATAGTANPATRTPDPPQVFSAEQVVNGINFTWDMPDDTYPDDITEIYEFGLSTPFSSASKIWSGKATSYFRVRTDTGLRYYWIRNVASNGNASTTVPATTGMPAKAASVSSALTIWATPGTTSKTGSAGTVTTDTITAAATGGTPGYTYAWTKVSGDSITVVSAATAATTFQATSVTTGETRTAIFRCTATDAAAATATVDVTVTITAAAMSVTLSPTTLNKFTASSSATTNTTTATASGGVAPYTYAWAKVSGDAINCASPSSDTTAFNASGLATGDSLSAIYRLTVTDSTGGTPLTSTADITVTITNVG